MSRLVDAQRSSLYWSDISPLFRLRLATYRSATFAVPLDGSILYMLTGSQQALERHGAQVPRTWQELLKFVAAYPSWLRPAVSAASGGETLPALPPYPICLPIGAACNQIPFFQSIWSSIAQTRGSTEGVHFDTSSGRPLLDTPAAREAFRIMALLMAAAAPAEPGEECTAGSLAFARGRCALTIAGFVAQMRLLILPEFKAVVRQEDLRVYPVPGSEFVWTRGQSPGSGARGGGDGALVRCTPEACPYATPYPGGPDDTNATLANHAPLSPNTNLAGALNRAKPLVIRYIGYLLLEYLVSPDRFARDEQPPMLQTVAPVRDAYVTPEAFERDWAAAGYSAALMLAALPTIQFTRGHSNRAWPLRMPYALHYHNVVSGILRGLQNRSIVLGEDVAMLAAPLNLSGALAEGQASLEAYYVPEDIQDSTLLWESVPAAAMAEALRLHHATVRRLLCAHGGYESTTEGDSFILAFRSVKQAATFALDLQAQLLQQPWPEALLRQPSGGVVVLDLPEGFPFRARQSSSLDKGGAGGAPAEPPNVRSVWASLGGATRHRSMVVRGSGAGNSPGLTARDLAGASFLCASLGSVGHEGPPGPPLLGAACRARSLRAVSGSDLMASAALFARPPALAAPPASATVLGAWRGGGAADIAAAAVGAAGRGHSAWSVASGLATASTGPGTGAGSQSPLDALRTDDFMHLSSLGHMLDTVEGRFSVRGHGAEGDEEVPSAAGPAVAARSPIWSPLCTALPVPPGGGGIGGGFGSVLETPAAAAVAQQLPASLAVRRPPACGGLAGLIGLQGGRLRQAAPLLQRPSPASAPRSAPSTCEQLQEAPSGQLEVVIPEGGGDGSRQGGASAARPLHTTHVARPDSMLPDDAAAAATAPRPRSDPQLPLTRRSAAVGAASPLGLRSSITGLPGKPPAVAGVLEVECLTGSGPARDMAASTAALPGAGRGCHDPAPRTRTQTQTLPDDAFLLQAVPAAGAPIPDALDGEHSADRFLRAPTRAEALPAPASRSSRSQSHLCLLIRSLTPSRHGAAGTGTDSEGGTGTPGLRVPSYFSRSSGPRAAAGASSHALGDRPGSRDSSGKPSAGETLAQLLARAATAAVRVPTAAAAARPVAAQLHLAQHSSFSVPWSGLGGGIRQPAPVFRGLRVRVGISWALPSAAELQRNAAAARMVYSGPCVAAAKGLADMAGGGQVVLSGEALAQLEAECGAGLGGRLAGAMLMHLGTYGLLRPPSSCAQHADRAACRSPAAASSSGTGAVADCASSSGGSTLQPQPPPPLPTTATLASPQDARLPAQQRRGMSLEDHLHKPQLMLSTGPSSCGTCYTLSDVGSASTNARGTIGGRLKAAGAAAEAAAAAAAETEVTATAALADLASAQGPPPHVGARVGAGTAGPLPPLSEPAQAQSAGSVSAAWAALSSPGTRPQSSQQLPAPQHRSQGRELRSLALYWLTSTALSPRLAVLPPLRLPPEATPLYEVYGAPLGRLSYVVVQVPAAPVLLAWDRDVALAALRVLREAAEAALQRQGCRGAAYLVPHPVESGKLSAAFSSAAVAVTWALDLRDALLGAPWPQELLAHELCEVVEARDGSAAWPAAAGAAKPQGPRPPSQQFKRRQQQQSAARRAPTLSGRMLQLQGVFEMRRPTKLRVTSLGMGSEGPAASGGSFGCDSGGATVGDSGSGSDMGHRPHSADVRRPGAPALLRLIEVVEMAGLAPRRTSRVGASREPSGLGSEASRDAAACEASRQLPAPVAPWSQAAASAPWPAPARRVVPRVGSMDVAESSGLSSSFLSAWSASAQGRPLSRPPIPLPPGAGSRARAAAAVVAGEAAASALRSGAAAGPFSVVSQDPLACGPPLTAAAPSAAAAAAALAEPGAAVIVPLIAEAGVVSGECERCFPSSASLATRRATALELDDSPLHQPPPVSEYGGPPPAGAGAAHHNDAAALAGADSPSRPFCTSALGYGCEEARDVVLLRGLRIRAGIACGAADPFLQDTTHSLAYHGRAVTAAKQLASVAASGQVLCDEATRREAALAGGGAPSQSAAPGAAPAGGWALWHAYGNEEGGGRWLLFTAAAGRGRALANAYVCS
ncbi:hypothetical protein GPECTOR_60g730 [Gonium pectorale]|uniref:Uncharacterized protein n=1 Tax=Gonium pectorale TaxID=33097 RepID=A0A150G588_GONPE|nr:hypothetical protein GPECTOR_60g730 [Gonium pectorale]|eukprot:KXZ44953.1 hypothetical protein GPECTOR_60g730 [Gonium pectorale]